MSSPPVFELFDNTLAGTTPDVLGLWTISPLKPPETAAYDIRDAPTSPLPSEVSLWRANLPANLHLADAYLTNGRARLQKCKQIRATVPARLETLARTNAGEIAFHLSPAADEQLTQPEQELLTFLSAFQVEARTEISFGWKDSLVGGRAKWQTTTEGFQALIRRVTVSVAYAIWVETYIENSWIGRTSIGWTGDTRTIWHQGPRPELIELHQKNLNLAISSRYEILQLLLLAVRAASQIAALLNMPANIIKILLVIWRYVNQIVQVGREDVGKLGS